MVCLVGFLFYFCGGELVSFCSGGVSSLECSLSPIFFFFLVALCSMRGLSFLTGDQTPTPCRVLSIGPGSAGS